MANQNFMAAVVGGAPAREPLRLLLRLPAAAGRAL